jgi:hypothetical protein
MRTAVLIATAVLLAGCAQHSVDGQAQRQQSAATAPSATAGTPTVTSSPTPAPPPGAAAPIAEVIAWVEAGRPAAADGFHSVTRDGAATDLGTDTAFVTPAGTAKCMTDRRAESALSCLVDLSAPPPRPPEAYGEWKGGWVDFPGATLTVGSAHGDPGPFVDGFGAELPSGQTLGFGDYRCRTAPGALFCVNYAHRSAVKLSTAGVSAYGCLKPVTPPPADVGRQFSC